MSSLQDQLLKAGLVDAKKAKQAGKEKRKHDKVARKTGQSETEGVKQQAKEARLQKAERDRELNQQRQQEVNKKALAAQIKQLINQHKQSSEAGKDEVEYHFADGKSVKKLRVSARIHRFITIGRLCIVKSGEKYELLPRVVADRIAERDASQLIVQSVEHVAESDEEDPYKDYVIPDDLMW